MDAIHVNAALLLSSHAIHTASSTNPTIDEKTVLKGCKWWFKSHAVKVTT